MHERKNDKKQSLIPMPIEIDKEYEMISVIQMASEIGTRKQTIFKVLDRLGIERILEKSETARGQKIAYVTIDDYSRIKDYFSGVYCQLSEIAIDLETGGVFYLIQLEPVHDPDRFKLGFATNIEERLRSHKTVAPFSKVLNTWPCKLLWEKTAIDCATQGCQRIHTEVFRSESIHEVQARLDQFFALMPDIRNR